MRASACLLFLLAACSGDDSGGSPADLGWRVAEANLGAPRATDTSADLSNTEGLWAQLAEVVPLLAYNEPATEVPFMAWSDLALSERVANEGTCPDVQAVGRTTTWETYGCRSSFGYEWDGSVSKEEWDEGGWRYARWDFALTVDADVDDPRFDALAVDGSLLYVIGDGETLDHAVQVNATTRLDGYWERQNATDPREALWTDWTLTARYEESASGVIQMEGTARLGDNPGFGFVSTDFSAAEGCASVPDGTLTLSGQQEASLTFSGSQGCSTCGALTVGGSTVDLCR